MSKPNILFIMADQFRADALHCNGGPGLTPNLDALASEGVLFTNCYTAAPLCVPARISLFTGKYPHTTTAWDNSVYVLDPDADVADSALEEIAYAPELKHSPDVAKRRRLRILRIILLRYFSVDLVFRNLIAKFTLKRIKYLLRLGLQLFLSDMAVECVADRESRHWDEQHADAHVSPALGASGKRLLERGPFGLRRSVCKREQSGGHVVCGGRRVEVYAEHALDRRAQCVRLPVRLLLLGRAQRKVDGMRLVRVDRDMPVVAGGLAGSRRKIARTSNVEANPALLVFMHHCREVITHVPVFVRHRHTVRPETRREAPAGLLALHEFLDPLLCLLLRHIIVYINLLAESLGHVCGDFIEQLAALVERQYADITLVVLAGRKMHARKSLVLAIEREPRLIGAEVRLGKMRFTGMVPVRDHLARLVVLADVLMRLDGASERLRILGRSDLKVKRRIDDDLAVLYAKSIAPRRTRAQHTDNARSENLHSKYFHARHYTKSAADAPQNMV